MHRNTIKSTCTQDFFKNNFGSKQYLTSKSSEVQKAQDQAPKQTEFLTALFAPTEGDCREKGWDNVEITATKTHGCVQCYLLSFTSVTYFIVLL